jgi:acetyltransferase-like isoleucine patch superfamily enzyme
MSAGLSPMQQATRVLWWSLRQLRYLWWGALNRLLPGRFQSIGRGVKFNGWVRFEKPCKDIRIGAGSMVGVGCYFCVDQNGSIDLGPDVGINDHCYITSNYGIRIGAHTRIAEFVSIRDYDHEFARMDMPISEQGFRGGPIEIGEDCWIGRGVIITGNVKIGRGCVIGANAVVTRDIPDYCVAVGVPAKVISNRREHGGKVEAGK